MKKSKIAAIALSAAMAFSMTACASNAEETQVEETETTVEETVAETSAVETSAAETVAETSAAETEPTEATEATIDEALVGSWTGEVEGLELIYTFNDDATGSVTMTEEGEDVDVPFTYNVPEEGTLTISVEFAGEVDSEDASYTVDGDTLTMDDGSSTVEFTRN